MEHKTILSKFQQQLLDFIIEEPYLLKNYYWSGGTALSEIYLHHRESYDIDLFTEKNEVHLPSVSKFVRSAAKKLRAKKIAPIRYLGLYSFTYILPNDSELKIDFNYYPFKRIETAKKYKKLEVDSLIDIAANKVHTIFMKPRGRDYIDLYLTLKENSQINLEKLILLADIKFDWHIDPLQLGENLSKVVTFTEKPKMFIPFNQQEMENYLLNLAKQLGSQILR